MPAIVLGPEDIEMSEIYSLLWKVSKLDEFSDQKKIIIIFFFTLKLCAYLNMLLGELSQRESQTWVMLVPYLFLQDLLTYTAS